MEPDVPTEPEFDDFVDEMETDFAAIEPDVDDFDEIEADEEAELDFEDFEGIEADLDGETTRIDQFFGMSGDDDDTAMPETIPVSDDELTSFPLEDELLPIDPVGDLMPLAETSINDGRWEYREIVLATWEQHMDNIEYALEQGGDKITIEDAYTKLLNDSGADGWELVSEQVLPQQFVRLLMKRLVRG
jgi:hypothetical protein